MTEDAPDAAACAAEIDTAAHLRCSGAAISDLVSALSAALAADDGRARRLAQIAARHADGHRADLEAALARSDG
ncbi:MAG: hypothetical protein ACRDOU_03045 [Streptosporangiaceae bacterium]